MTQDQASIHPYQGRKVVLATKHQKEQVLGPPLQSAVGLMLCVPKNLDTDVLGTFTGEVERIGTPRETALKKARWGMAVTGLPLGLASEGSFGPDPQLLFAPTCHELLAFVDDERGIEVIEQIIDLETNYANQSVHHPSELQDFLVRVKFPSHGLIVRPNSGFQPGFLFKGITDTETLHQAVTACASSSEDGLAYVQTDMRAHMNPMRRQVLAKVATKLGQRLATLCPRCSTPGWGLVDLIRGLPCEWCGGETLLTHLEVYGCPGCGYKENQPRHDGLHFASAAHCPRCNP